MNEKKWTPAIQIIIIFGIISMLGDIVYEGARSANSQYLRLLEVSATDVGLVFGIGEFLGYFLRLISGVLSDRSKSHWTFLFLGYGMLLVVPLMGLKFSTSPILAFILMERIGKALRSPAKDTILSNVAKNQMGVGFAFGLQEALDQVGAFLGPIIFTLVFYFTGKSTLETYRVSYMILIIPFLLLMGFLTLSYFKIRSSNLLKEVETKEFRNDNLQKIFWYYSAFTFFCTLGFVNFSTIGYHLKASALMKDESITFLYGFAMIIDAIFALIIGKTYDRFKESSHTSTGGIRVLFVIPFLTLFSALFATSLNLSLIIISMIGFGVIMAAHETIMRSAIADITPYSKRGTSFGLFNAIYGVALLLGASSMGRLYDLKLTTWIPFFSLICEGIAVIIYLRMHYEIQKLKTK